MSNQNPTAKKYELLLDLGNKLWISRVDIDDLQEQNENARVMRQDAFNQLTSNIIADKRLESLPFCALVQEPKEHIEIISGHHRIRSLRIAANTLPELRKTFVILDVGNLSRDQIRSKQLAHNSIQGNDDQSMLLRIYQQIDDAELRVKAFIDEQKLLDVSKPPALKLTAAPNEFTFKTIRLFMLPKQLTDVDKAIALCEGSEDRFYIASVDGHEKLLEAMSKIVQDEDIRSVGFAFARMAELALERLAQKTPGAQT